MTQETLDFVKEKTVALIAAHSCSAEAKAAAENGLLLSVLRKKQK